MEMFFKHGSNVHRVDMERNGDEYRITINDELYVTKAVEVRPGLIHMDMGGGAQKFVVSLNKDERHVFLKGGSYKLLRVDDPGSRTVEDDVGDLNSPITGKIVSVKVAPGDVVEEKQTLMVLEAMKMEYQIKAPYAGTVVSLLYNEGDGVEMGSLLIELEKTGEGPEK